ncbi:MAG: hypothetical protein M0P64_04150 [Candidatus Pacebacteria bacterium]|jgi:uncharacterized membrane protein|nr:hypothetical protein [Candidatus Paceibacterota bacterium]
MNIHLIVLILAIIGEMVTIYLFAERTKKRPPVCPIGDGCSVVWESPYSKTCGVGNDILGIIFYTLVGIIELAFLAGCTFSYLIPIEYMVLLGGALLSCYFVYLEARVICAWCFWCTLSAFLTWGMATVRFVL